MTSFDGAGVLLGLGASAAWGVANRYVQQAARADGELPSLWWGQVVASLCYLPIWLLDGAPFGRISAPILVGTAMSAMLGYYSMARAYRLGPLTVMVPIVATWSAITALVGVLLLGERPGPLHLLGAALAVGGSVANSALRGPAGDPGWHAPKAVAVSWAAGSSLGFGLLMVGVADITRVVGPAGAMPLVWATQWILFAPLWPGRAAMARWPTAPRAAAAMGALEALGFLCAAIGTRVAPLAEVGPAASLSSVLTVVAVRLWTGESVPLARWLCVGIATVGVVLLAMPGDR